MPKLSAKSTRRRKSSANRRHRTPEDLLQPERLQKVLAAAGVASRRECEQLIREGRVEVDRSVVTRLGVKVDPEVQEIRVDGTVLRPRKQFVYYAVNKPRGVISTSSDPSGRPQVVDLVPQQVGRVFSVGRLDASSEGLMLLTNDGELANLLAHPRYGVEKTYLVQVAGQAGHELTRALREGIRLAEGFARAKRASVHRRLKRSTILKVVLAEGKNREIRRILAALGHKVQRLKRVALGPLKLGELPEGSARELTRTELQQLRRTTSPRSSEKSQPTPAAEKKRPPRRRRSRRSKRKQSP